MATNYARQNNASKATITMEVLFAEGSFKNVYKGIYIEGERKGEACVCKIFKSGSVFENSYFKNELKVVEKALEIINKFNVDGFVNQNIWLNMPTIWVFDKNFTRPGEKALVEPMIANFEKFNSNTGWMPTESSPWIEVMQALSHFSYHSTDRKLLLCDLQGGIYKDGFIITDPVIMSNIQEYGPTDLGSDGISTFFAYHRCNKFCRKDWLAPAPQDKKKYFKVQKGSAMMRPMSASGVPLPAIGGIDSGYVSMNRLPELIEDLEI